MNIISFLIVRLWCGSSLLLSAELLPRLCRLWCTFNEVRPSIRCDKCALRSSPWIHRWHLYNVNPFEFRAYYFEDLPHNEWTPFSCCPTNKHSIWLFGWIPFPALLSYLRLWSSYCTVERGREQTIGWGGSVTARLTLMCKVDQWTDERHCFNSGKITNTNMCSIKPTMERCR